jgi:hypothetical protein
LVLPSTSVADPAYLRRIVKSRAGITPHGLPHDCRLRGSADLSYIQSMKAKMVAFKLDNLGTLMTRWARRGTEGMAMRERDR